MNHFGPKTILLAASMALCVAATTQAAELTIETMIPVDELYAVPTEIRVKLFDAQEGGHFLQEQIFKTGEWRSSLNLSQGLPRNGKLDLKMAMDVADALKGEQLWAEVSIDGRVIGSRLAASVANARFQVQGDIVLSQDPANPDNTGRIYFHDDSYLDKAPVQVSGSCSVGRGIRIINTDGSVTCGAEHWRLNGNAIGAGGWLGTSNTQPLVFRVNGRRIVEYQDANSLSGDHAPNILAGGESNEISVSVSGATVSGGSDNIASAFFATVSGGVDNTASGGSGTVSGGLSNAASGDSSTVSGGSRNVASAFWSTVCGGQANTARKGNATVCGGAGNVASGEGATVPGGAGNQAGGSYSLAAGNRAIVRDAASSGDSDGDEGTFIWADDSTDADFISTGANQFLVRASGGMGIGTNAPQNQLHVVESINAVGYPENHVMQIENSSTGSSADGLAIVVGTRDSSLSGANNFITFFAADSSGDPISVGAIEGAGGGSGVAYRTSSADFAEYLPLAEGENTPDAGAVLGLVAGRLSHDLEHAERVLVVSNSAGFVGNGQEDSTGKVLVAFMGQVPVNIQGRAEAGDWLVVGRDGKVVAKKPEAVQPEQFRLLVGKVLASGESQVVTLVGLPPYELLAVQQQRLIAAEIRNQRQHQRLARLEAAVDRFEALVDRQQQALEMVKAVQQDMLVSRQLVMK